VSGRRRVTAARIAHSRRAARTHGLFAVERRGTEALPPDAPEVRALGTVEDLEIELVKLRDASLWTAMKLGERMKNSPDAITTEGAGAFALYADVAGRCQEGYILLRTGKVGPLGNGALSAEEYAEELEQSRRITELQLVLPKMGMNWLSKNGVYRADGRLQPLLKQRFGTFIEKARRATLRHAALLAMGADDDDTDLVLQAVRSEQG